MTHLIGASGIVSANARVAALVRRLGFEPVGGAAGDSADEGVAPGWLEARGWRSVTWRLTRDRWIAGATP